MKKPTIGTIRLSEIKKHPYLSLSPQDYLKEDNKNGRVDSSTHEMRLKQVKY